MVQSRNTVQLAIVRDALYELADHPTADEVYGYVHAAQPSISRATVYRTLNKLADQGLARKVRALQGADRFDHTIAPHSHAQCRQCGKVVDVQFQPAQDAFDSAQQQSGFRITAVNSVFLGICPECAEKERQELTEG